VLRRGQRHASPKGLPGPFDVSGGVVVSVQARSPVWASVPADGEILVDQRPTPAPPL